MILTRANVIRRSCPAPACRNPIHQDSAVLCQSRTDKLPPQLHEDFIRSLTQQQRRDAHAAIINHIRK